MKTYNIAEIKAMMGLDWVQAQHPAPVLPPAALMIGDWVLAAHPRSNNEIYGRPVRIFRLHEDIGEPIGVETAKNSILRNQVSVRYIIPLPLTTDILARNATEVVSYGAVTYYVFSRYFAVKVIGEQKCFCFICRKDTKIADHSIGDIFNVHELQHLLRLPFVGLAEKAENFTL